MGDAASGGENFGQELTEKKIERLEGRLTFQSILVFLLFLSLGVFFYFDFTHRIARVQDTGASRVEDLSRQLRADLDYLSTTLDERTKGIHAALTDLRNAQAANRDLARQVGANLDRLSETALTLERGKILLADQEKAASREREKISGALEAEQKSSSQARESLRKDLADFSAQVASLVESSAGLKTSVETMNQKIAEFSLSLNTLARAKVDKTLLDELLAHQQAVMESQMAETDKTAKALELRLRALETDLGRVKKEVRTDNTPAPKESSPSAPPPPPGKIIEQDLN
ncbi:MAG: hypothetical protein KKA60_09180 [Proteobacteria bacterium]|nr:hypothetical protein [Pseudomonadota bacterium]